MSTLNTTVKIKRSTTQGAVPSYESLSAGELALNQKDGRLFYRGSDSGEVSSFIDSDLLQTELTSNYLNLTGGTLTGDIILPAIVTTNNQGVVTKAYVDGEVANAGVSEVPTGDFGLLSEATENDAFAQPLFVTFDMLTTPVGTLATTDLGIESSDSAI